MTLRTKCVCPFDKLTFEIAGNLLKNPTIRGYKGFQKRSKVFVTYVYTEIKFVRVDSG